MRRKPYPPSLRHRIKLNDIDARARRDHARKPKEEARANALTDIKMEKMLELLDHYGIKGRNGSNAWWELALELSEAHVPGMSVNRSGRPKDLGRKAGGDTREKLSKVGQRLMEISAEAKRTSASISASVKAAAKRKGSALHGANTETARKAYSAASGAGGLGYFLAKPPRSNRSRKK